jgi:hypothetical protein
MDVVAVIMGEVVAHPGTDMLKAATSIITISIMLDLAVHHYD